MNTANPLVSAVMPIFNGGHFLKYSLESIRSQDYPNLEIIFIDDGSTDGSREIVELFSYTWPGGLKILAHPNGQRQGIAASYRLGLEHCQGQYIAFLEQDDAWPANKVSEQIKVFHKFPEVGVVFSDVYTCDEQGRIAARVFKPLLNRPPSERPFDAFVKLLWGNCVATFSNFMIRRDRMNITDIISEPEGFQDWMLLLLMASRCQFYHCSQTKTFWRQQRDSYHGKLRQMPNFTSRYRQLRKAALRNAIDKILLQRNPRCSNSFILQRLLKGYWHSMISLSSAAERMAEVLTRRYYSRALSPVDHKTNLKIMTMKEQLTLSASQ
jgi:glycosyltransferase involved in cell wall biosynthesis